VFFQDRVPCWESIVHGSELTRDFPAIEHYLEFGLWAIRWLKEFA